MTCLLLFYSIMIDVVVLRNWLYGTFELSWGERGGDRGDIALSAVICGRIDSGVRWTEERWYCLWCSALPVLLHHSSLRFPGRAATEAPANIPVNRRNSTQIRAVLDLCWQTSAGTGLFIPIFHHLSFLQLSSYNSFLYKTSNVRRRKPACLVLYSSSGEVMGIQVAF